MQDIEGLKTDERVQAALVADEYAFRASEYYLGLIDFDDPDDPIRKLIIPDARELMDGGSDLDPSNEETYTRVPGLQHKYPHIALLLVNDLCGGCCRFCFRKRLFMQGNREVAEDISGGIEYIREHREITNVLLTGGTRFFCRQRSSMAS